MKKPIFETGSNTNPKIRYKIFEDELNYSIGFYKNKNKVSILEQDFVFSIPEQGLEVAKEMAESTIMDYIND
jgi:hypothetical protein